jgi:hypothetical protein
MRTNYWTIILVGLVTSFCTQENSRSNAHWVESNAICVHWSEFGKKNFDTKAIRLVLRASSSSDFTFKEYYFNTRIVGTSDLHFPLGKVRKVKKVKNFYLLYLFIKSEDLYELFPEGMNKYGDDCYHIELANMIGQGKIIEVDVKSGMKTEIVKSLDYSFYVGTQ